VHRRAREREALEMASRVGLDVDPRASAGSLSLHQKQMLLIARAMAQQARFLILDEPSASLSLQECTALFALIELLRRDGVGIVYVSHRLQEIEQTAIGCRLA